MPLLAEARFRKGCTKGSGVLSSQRSLLVSVRKNVHAKCQRLRPYPSKLIAAVFFACYESTKSLLRHAIPSVAPDACLHAVSSAGAEMASCIVLTPAEVVKQNAQVLRQSSRKYADRSSSLRAVELLRQRGNLARTLWRGYTVLVARNLPFTATQFPLFEFFRGHLWRRREERRSGNVEPRSPDPAVSGRPRQGALDTVGSHGVRTLFVDTAAINGTAAAASGALAAILTTPVDVVKTRVMLLSGVQSGNQPGKATCPRQSVWEETLGVAKAIFREGGTRALFRGATLRAAWAALGSGLYLGSYEVAKAWLRRHSSSWRSRVA